MTHEEPLYITIEARPLTLDELRAWLVARGVRGAQLPQMVREHAGSTLAEMEALYDAQHGSMA
jgi:hypothetical protein